MKIILNYYNNKIKFYNNWNLNNLKLIIFIKLQNKIKSIIKYCNKVNNNKIQLIKNRNKRNIKNKTVIKNKMKLFNQKLI